MSVQMIFSFESTGAFRVTLSCREPGLQRAIVENNLVQSSEDGENTSSTIPFAPSSRAGRPLLASDSRLQSPGPSSIGGRLRLGGAGQPARPGLPDVQPA